MKETWEKIREKFKSINPTHRTLAIIGFFAIITIISFMMTKPDGYTTIYKDLSEQSKQEILVELSKMGISYKLDETGTQISVKKQDTWVIRELTQIGLPSDGKQGYDMFSESMFGATQQDRELRELSGRKNQLEIELVRNFHYIESASVSMTLPEKTGIFESEKAKGSASVTLGLKRGTKLTRQQMLGIQHMVSSALTGVEAEDVKIIDTRKGIISDVLNEDEFGSSAYEKQLSITERAQENIELDIKDSLASLFGFENVKINVNLAIDFDEIIKNIEKYDPNKVLRSTNTTKDNTYKTENVENPEAGIDANGEVVGYDVDDENGDTVYRSEKENIIENFEISKTVEQIKKYPEITNTNVVVWLNKKTLEDAGIDPAEFDVDEFRKAVGLAAGMKLTEEDTFENGQVMIMKNQKFAEPVEEPVVVKEWYEELLDRYLLHIVGGAIGLLLLVFILSFMLLKKKKKKQKQTKIIEKVIERQIAVDSQNNGEGADSVVAQTPNGAAKPISPEEFEQRLKELKDGESGEEFTLEDDEFEMMKKQFALADEEYEKMKREYAEKDKQKMLEDARRKREEKERLETEEKMRKLSKEYPRETAEYIRRLLNERR